MSDGLEGDYNTSGEPALLRRRDEVWLRIDKLRRMLAETKAERVRLKALQGAASSSDLGDEGTVTTRGQSSPP